MGRKLQWFSGLCLDEQVVAYVRLGWVFVLGSIEHAATSHRSGPRAATSVGRQSWSIAVVHGWGAHRGRAKGDDLGLALL
ncbi:hypothetical protein [Candidatus Methylacidithermus pantelleriae]|uniref:Uncharacterized protein n=1 Tax=Candidatus Methylacidithermus pantelleriae TaxID=2744239 RepID=A0A8J2BHB1_9BACT|nr:hypothetical protein [Candidatus Methylacidithermus pantelleriae]CAF0694399.1 hypothetical protein MPNT_160040 [Candidatus Methylacidithermus pantelleriae]